MAIRGSSASRTPVRVVPVNSVNNFCRVCNINLVRSGIGKFNLFDKVRLKEQNIAAKLSSVLEFRVKNVITASSVLCMKCKSRDSSPPVFAY